MEAGLCAGDLITHVNGTSVNGLLHIELVRLILTGGPTVSLCTVPLSSTSIRLGTRRHSGEGPPGPGHGGVAGGIGACCTLPVRHRKNRHHDVRRRSSLFRQLSSKKAAEQQHQHQLVGSTTLPASTINMSSLSSNDSVPNSPTTGPMWAAAAGAPMSTPHRLLRSNAAIESWISDSAHSTGNSSSQSRSVFRIFREGLSLYELHQVIAVLLLLIKC